ncbi:phospholipase D-like domain-containing protein [Azomonas macrocytogenes]|uniref:Phosphatidylserine/phosphatidylglycerophosphate/ cardiolipin synthase-like enzyme n=1 Tax=Azomonas macrocytogenes TaxID=69962 RepID=A0A839SZL5_AZOMA|nr:phosphatidylserine/phosphatidylglycerophosphate/cardiolipin synthase family protein [Azomonas macrocytogenes]MBB3101686.1 phosphatidylserine/phosphatidylglycerophosphate/cardiolipin synthase-like enzyme [Azomonas macrocytogenes]
MNIAGPVFPWRDGNRFRLLVDGPQFFPSMLEAIGKAEYWVDLEFYLVEDGRCAESMVDALIAAAGRGVRVRCLFDGFGSLKLGQARRERLTNANVALRLYNPLAINLRFRNLHRDHRKILLVDGCVGFVGGAGITDEFWNPDKPDEHWHEVMVQMEGPLLQDWKALFDAQWVYCRRRHIWQLPLPIKTPKLPVSPSGGPGMGRVAYSAARQHRDVLHNLLRHLHHAKQRIYLATPYFLPTGKVRRALIRAAHRGIEVRLLLTSQNTDNPPVRYAGQRFYPRLLRAGVRIHEYLPDFLHLKMVVVDDWMSVGSCNFDHWNLLWNLEANLETTDPPVIAAALATFERDFALSHEVTLEKWHARPLLSRIHQRLWGLLDRLLMSLFNQRQ